MKMSETFTPPSPANQEITNAVTEFVGFPHYSRCLFDQRHLQHRGPRLEWADSLQLPSQHPRLFNSSNLAYIRLAGASQGYAYEQINTWAPTFAALGIPNRDGQTGENHDACV